MKRDIADIVKDINKRRLNAGDQWWYYEADHIRIKANGTWIQRMYIKGTEPYFSTPMGLSVTDFKKYLTDTLTAYPPLY